MYSSSNTVNYYVMNSGANKVYILNNEWKFISFKTFTDPQSMISIGNCLYVNGDENVWKLDQDLNVLINYNKTGGNPGYHGISYNPSNGLSYVVAHIFKEIKVLNLDLTLI